MSAAAAATTPGTDTDAWRRASEIVPDGVYERCVGPLLRVTGWQGDATMIVEAMPHLGALRDLNDLRIALRHVGLRSSVTTATANQISSDLLPAVATLNGRPRVILSRSPAGFRLFDPETQTVTETKLYGDLRLCTFRKPIASELRTDKERRWFRSAIVRLRGDLGFVMALSLGINLLVLATPLFTMGVFNLVLPSESAPTLALGAAAVIGAVALEFRLRRERAMAVASATTRISNAVATAGFAKIVSFPYSMFDRSSVSRQISWLKQFEGVMSAFSGPVCAAMLDLPFVLLLLLAIGFIGGPLAIPPLIALILLVVVAILLAAPTERTARAATEANAAHAALLREALSSVRAIRDAGQESVWRARLAAAHRDAVAASVRAARLQALTQNICTALIALTTVAILAAGAVLAMDGAFSIGGLVAVTMLSGRVFGPVQTLLMRAHPLANARSAARRFEALLEMDVGRDGSSAPAVIRGFRGGVEYREVSFRFRDSERFALRGLDARIEPGDVVAVVGPNGSGKSLALKLTAGLYRPSAGLVVLDGAPLSQLHPSEIRAAVAYQPATPRYFYGTVAQNMRLAAPTATKAQIEAALDEAGVDLAAFQDGLETRMSAQGYDDLPSALRHRLALARLLVRDAPLTLIDMPAEFLEAVGTERLAAVVKARAGRSSFLIASSDPASVSFAEKFLILDKGRMKGLFNGPNAKGDPPDQARAS